MWNLTLVSLLTVGAAAQAEAAPATGQAPDAAGPAPVVLLGERVLHKLETGRVVIEDGTHLRCPDGKSLIIGARAIEWRGEVRIDCPGNDVTIGAREHTFADGSHVTIDSPQGWVRFIAWRTVGEPSLEVHAMQADVDPDHVPSDLTPLVTTRVRRSLLRRLIQAAPAPGTGAEVRVHFPREKWHSQAKARRRQGWLAMLALDAAGRNLTVTSGSDRAAGAHAEGRAIDIVGPPSFGERLRVARRLSASLGKRGLVLVEEVDPRPRAGAPAGFQCNVAFRDGAITSVHVGVRYRPDLKRKRQSSPFHATRSHMHVTMFRGRKVPPSATVVALEGEAPSGRGKVALADGE
ncbi:MAG: hypothetical protein IT370_29280 [Deltaproteobacteria bacterium]|nr:hypothetical protein [Deltaproteobacteria bacterium]